MPDGALDPRSGNVTRHPLDLFILSGTPMSRFAASFFDVRSSSIPELRNRRAVNT
jgi:hypothetical protein